MSLINDMMEAFTIMNKIRVADGEGGFTTTWEAGAGIMCALVNDTSMQARIAEAERVTSTYTITTHKDVDLDFHDVIRRDSDNKCFRITSDPNDKVSPKPATFEIKQFTAEAWVLT